MSEHRVNYPLEFSAMEPRELARLSQSNVTPDPSIGVQYAAAAYDAGLKTNVAETDPTLAGEAAAKAGLRTGQLGDNTGAASWFKRSYEALDRDDVRTKRELAATHLLEGRSLALQLIRSTVDDSLVTARARETFAAGENILRQQHQHGKRWDPYATMLSRHRATHEAVNGSASVAAGIAMRGIWRAARSRREEANSPSGRLKHLKFVEKQAMVNYAAELLALSRPLGIIPPAQRVRRQIALKLLS